MGAWCCHGCLALLPGAHPIERGEDGWDPNEPMLCAGCGTEAAFSTIEKLVLDREEFLAKNSQARSSFEYALFEAIRETREKIDRVAGLVGGM